MDTLPSVGVDLVKEVTF